MKLRGNLILLMAMVCHFGSAGHSTGSPDEANQQTPKSLAISYNSQWFLEIFEDGSGHLQYGSLFQDRHDVPKGTFDLRGLSVDLAKHDLRADLPEERQCFYSVVLPESDDRIAKYLLDTPLIRQVFEQAIKASNAMENERFKSLIQKHPLPPHSASQTDD